MGLDQQEVLSRFHQILVREFGSRAPWDLSASLTVADIFHNLVPFQSRREELGVHTMPEYEHALLRLLAGHGDFLTVESTTTRRRIRDELESANPDMGIYRDFPAADVRLNPDKVEMPLVPTKVEGFPPSEACAWCKGAMPQEDRVKFCPSCGKAVTLVPCPACGEELDHTWRFCVACGSEGASTKGH
jgi:hypothetical protein